MNKLFLGTLLALSAGGALLSPAPHADTLDRRITLFNRSHEAIREFHASNVDENGYQEDILGRSVLPPGYHVVINLNDGTGHCRFDFMTVMEDGKKVFRRDVNVCRLTDYTIYD